MKAQPVRVLLSLLLLALALSLAPQQTAAAQIKLHAGVLIHSVQAKKICVGDTVTISGATSVSPAEDIQPPLAWIPATHLAAKAELGQITPAEIQQFNDGFYFDLTYKATQPGTETITLVVNQGIASTIERFEVEEKCDYDAFVTTVMHFSADLGEEMFESLTHVTGMGTMKRDRQGSEFYQGEGKWRLEEKILSKPAICVEYYVPPLILSGPFDLDGRLDTETDSVDVILSFLPAMGKSYYHGESICVDESGEKGYGYSYGRGGDPSLASTIEDTFPAGGGTRSVQLTGKGMEIVQSVGNLDYTATLTLIPR